MQKGLGSCQFLDLEEWTCSGVIESRSGMRSSVASGALRSSKSNSAIDLG